MRIAVCDDEITQLEYFRKLVSKCFDSDGISTEILSFSDGEELLESHKKELFDVIFLDIVMPAKDGFQTAKEIRRISAATYIIFMTSKDELVYDCLDFQPFNFIRKSDTAHFEEKTKAVVDKLIYHSRQNQCIQIDAKNVRDLIAIRDIVYLKSDSHYTEYYLSDGRVLRQRERISDSSAKLAEYDFVRVHKRFVVNLRHISLVDNKNDEILLSDNTRILMSRNFKRGVSEARIRYMRSLI